MTATIPADANRAGRRRQATVVVGATACAVFAVVGVAASTFIKSPEQARAEAGPPRASTLTAPVERRVLTSTVVTRGTAVAETSIEVTPVAAGAGAQVVTATTVRKGDEIRAGQVLIAVSGRPLIALAGRVPAYRDLKPGDSGEDIEQLQHALAQLGFASGDGAGTFGVGTKAAVRRLYTKLGFDVPDTGGPGGRADVPALTAAADAVDAATQAVDGLRRRIAAGEGSGPGEEGLVAQLARLEQQLARAIDARADLQRRTGPMVPLAEIVFVPSFPARVAALSAKVGDTVRTPLITLASGPLAVVAKLRPDQAALVQAGMKVGLASETVRRDAEAMVSSVGELTAGAENEAPYHLAAITPTSPLGQVWSGLDVRVTITAAQTDAEVLVVPLSAVSAGADGRTTVSVLDPGGTASRVEVRPGPSGDGYVAVEPVGAELRPGDAVIVGAVS